MTFTQIMGTTAATQPFNTGAVSGTDDESPLTTSYSFSISQRLPFFSSLFEASYVGSDSKYQLNQNGVGTNANVIPAGRLYQSDVTQDPSKLNNGGEYIYGPFPIYQVISVVNHNLSSNYNSMQLSWVR